MDPIKSSIFFILFYTCFLTPLGGATRLADCPSGGYEMETSWYHYANFAQEWTPKEESFKVKTAAKPSAVAKSLSFLDKNRSFWTGDVWGLWDYGNENRFISYTLTDNHKYNEYYFPFETTLVTLQIKYYSSGPINGRIWPCAMATHNFYESKNLCEFSSTDANNDWIYVYKPVLVSEEGMGFELNTQDGNVLIIDEVAFNQRTHPCHEPQEEEKTEQ